MMLNVTMDADVMMYDAEGAGPAVLTRVQLTEDEDVEQSRVSHSAATQTKAVCASFWIGIRQIRSGETPQNCCH